MESRVSSLPPAHRVLLRDLLAGPGSQALGGRAWSAAELGFTVSSANAPA